MKYITILVTLFLVFTMTGCVKEKGNLKDQTDGTQSGKPDEENTEDTEPTKAPT